MADICRLGVGFSLTSRSSANSGDWSGSSVRSLSRETTKATSACILLTTTSARIRTRKAGEGATFSSRLRS